MSAAYRQVAAAVRDWQQGAGTADQAAQVALQVAGTEEGARQLLRRAVAWWQYLATYRDCNGSPIAR